MEPKKPELLAPAGDRERLEAAVRYGADAVYLAGKSFGMRSAPANFGPEELAQAVDFCHQRGVKVYVTCNTLPRNEEFAALPGFLTACQEAGVDAFIISDLGVLALAGKVAPQVERHISTQTGIVNYAPPRSAGSWGPSGWCWPGRCPSPKFRASGRTPTPAWSWRPLSTGPCACPFPAGASSPTI